MKPPSAASPQERILFHLKTRGPQTAAQLARRLDVTPTAVRQHLAQLTEDGLVTHVDERGSVGRPARVWHLSERGHARFPEGYAELAVDLLEQVRGVFGAKGLARLLDARTDDQREAYREAVPGPDAELGKRVAALARLRTEEGYMAEWTRARDGSVLLVENHCPVCAAAQVCQGLCERELELFRDALGDDVEIERTEHFLDGARRCVYRIAAKG